MGLLGYCWPNSVGMFAHGNLYGKFNNNKKPFCSFVSHNRLNSLFPATEPVDKLLLPRVARVRSVSLNFFSPSSHSIFTVLHIIPALSSELSLRRNCVRSVRLEHLRFGGNIRLYTRGTALLFFFYVSSSTRCFCVCIVLKLFHTPLRIEKWENVRFTGYR